MDHRGFHNMATFLGHKYFRMIGFDFEYEGRTGDWHGDDVAVEEDILLDTIGVAVALAHETRS
jgi:protein O-GlcNAc transferase